MFLRVSLLSIATLALLGGGVAAASTESPKADCFGDQTVTKVVAHHEPVTAGQGSYQQLAGARAYVAAKPGLTGEWLHALLERRSSDPQPGTECPLDVPGVSISVRSAGPGFWVALSSKDSKDAKEVLRRAQTLTR
jgi:hypothetical protein